MIAESFRRVLRRQPISQVEEQALVNWFSRMEDMPDLKDGLFKDQSTKIDQVSQISDDLGTIVSGVLDALNSGSIRLDLDNAAFSIMDSDFGDAGIQLQYNNGSPRFYIGNGAAQYLRYTGGVLSISGTVEAAAGHFGGWTLGPAAFWSLDLSNIGVIADASVPYIGVGNFSTTGYIKLDGANLDIHSGNFSAGASGFRIDALNGNAEFNNIIARGVMQTVVFRKDVVSAIGGHMLLLPADALDADMTAADNSSLTIKGNETFAVGDFLRMKDSTNDEWLEVTDASSAPTYVVTRDKAGSYGANANPAWKTGQAVVNYMQSGDGGILMLSGAVPALKLFNHSGAPWSSITEEVVLSELGISAGGGKVVVDRNGIVFAGGAGVLSADGMTMTGLLMGLSFSGTNNGVDAQFLAGFTGDDTNPPSFDLCYYGAEVGAELVTNGYGETGDATGWTAVTGLVSNSNEYVYQGAYALCDAAGSSPATAKSSARFAVTAGTSYNTSGAVRGRVFSSVKHEHAVGDATIKIKWYDAASGGTLLRTDSICNLHFNGYTDTKYMTSVWIYASIWQYLIKQFVAPVGATHAEIVCDVTLTTSPAHTMEVNVWWDNVSVASTGILSKISFLGDGWIQTVGAFRQADNTPLATARNLMKPRVCDFGDNLAETVSPFTIKAFAAGGNTNGTNAESNHPGMIQFVGNGINWGAYVTTSTILDILIQGGEVIDVIFKTYANHTATRIVVGFIDSFGIPSTFTNAAWMDSVIATGVMTGYAKTGGATSSTGSSYTLGTSTWYRGVVAIRADLARVDFYIYDMAGTLLWHDYVTTNIPASQLVRGSFGGFHTAANANVIVYLDRLAVYSTAAMLR